MSEKHKETAMLSIRVTPEERALIERAAEHKHWKPAQFIRVSALERAASILNVTGPTSFDFSGLAKHLAYVLAGERDVTLSWKDKDLGRFPTGPADSHPLNGSAEILLEDVYVEKFDPILDQAHLELFREAVRLGGAEFAEKLVAECKALLSSDLNHTTLPPPIDPHKLNG